MVASFYKWLIIPALASFNLLNSPGKSVSQAKDHPIFVSVTEVNHNSTDKTLEISSKIFVDDFEKVLTQKYKSVVSIGHPKDVELLHAQIAQYIGERFSLKVDGKNVGYKYIGYEKEEDAVYCYFEVANVNAVTKIDATNTLLHDLNNNQINIMHITVNGTRKSLKLDYPNSTASFSF